MQPRRVVQVAKIPKQTSVNSTRRTLARLCYYYPQYTLAAARKLPARDVALLLKEASRLEAARNHNLMQMIAAPNSEKGKAVKELLEHFNELMQ